MRPLPVYEGVISLPACQSSCLIGFDSRGLPFIEANSDDDAYFAQGFVIARERLFQMEMLRRTAQGLLSQAFGISFLPQDRLMRTLGFQRLAVAELGSLENETRAAVNSYVRGVNAYIDYADKKNLLPLEFSLLGLKPARWRPEDCLAIFKYLSFQQDESWKLDELRSRVLMRAGPSVFNDVFADDLVQSLWTGEKKEADAAKPAKSKGKAKEPAKAIPARAITITETGAQPPLLSNALSADLQKLAGIRGALPAAGPTWGSNAWVINSGKEKSAALLACDKHAAFSLPDLWIFCSLKSPSLHVAGITVPGIPGVLIGRNERVGWAYAAMKADCQDLYVEHFESDFSPNYATPDGAKQADEVLEIIPVRFGNSVEHKITKTRHGPVLLRTKETGIALAWTGFETKNSAFNCFYRLNRAESWSDFLEATGTYGTAPQVFLYADAGGSSGFRCAGDLPVRPKNWGGTVLAEGWSGQGDWQGLVPGNYLPAKTFAAKDPNRSGLAIACGQKITCVNSDGDPVMVGHQWNPPYRANRVFDSLMAFAYAGKVEDISLTLFNELQTDQFSYLAAGTVRILQDTVLHVQSVDKYQLKAVETISKWDGKLAAGACEPALLEAYLVTVARRLLEPKLGKELTAEYLERWPLWVTMVDKYMRQRPSRWLPPEARTHETFILECFDSALTRLRLASGAESLKAVHWGQLHQILFEHPLIEVIGPLGRLLSFGRIGVGGDGNVLNTCDASTAPTGGFPSRNGPSARLLMDMSDPGKIYGCLALGQSGHLFSPYRNDQITAWLKGDPLPIAFDAALVDKVTKTKLYLTPVRLSLDGN